MNFLSCMIRSLVAIFLFSSLLVGCDVHEFPQVPDSVNFYLNLKYQTDMSEWNHVYEDSKLLEKTIKDGVPNVRHHGSMRYIVRVYPRMEDQKTRQEHIKEIVFVRDLSAGYDCGVSLDLPSGKYDIRVWSDMVEYEGTSSYYDANDLKAITLTGDYVGSVDYRDAFRGSKEVFIESDILESPIDTLDVLMERPMAKFEFVTTDLKEFIDKLSRNKIGDNSSEIDLNEYKVVFQYVGFVPDTYNALSDKPIDATVGLSFESTLKQLNETVASFGFDYVFVNGSSSYVSLQLSLCDKDDKPLSRTAVINVPIKRNHHTIIEGSFLMSLEAGGVTVNPNYNGDHNIII